MTKKKSFLFMALCLVLGIAIGAGTVLGIVASKKTDSTETASQQHSMYDMLGATPTTSTTDDQQTYIVDLKLAAAYWDRYACNATSELRDAYGMEYQRVQDFNLNRDCGTTTDCIYLYESRAYDKSSAITNLLAVCSDSEITETVAYDDFGIMYEVIGGIRINGLHSSVSKYVKIDCNMNAGGKYIYLFATRCTAYEPLTDINIESDVVRADASYIGVCSKSEPDRWLDFNKGAGGADIFVTFTRTVTGWVPYELVAVDYEPDGSELYKTYTLAVRDKKILAEHLRPWLDKGEYTHFNGFIYSDGTAVQIGDTVKYDGMQIYASWTYDIEIDLSEFGMENEYKTNVIKIGSFPSVSKAGYLLEGWRFADTKQGAGPYNILRRGGLVEPILVKSHPKYFESFTITTELVGNSGTFLYSIYKNGLTDSEKYHGTYLGELYVLHSKGYDYVDGQVVRLTDKKALVTTAVDYSAATAEEKTMITQYAQFLSVANDTDCIFTIDYYMTEGAAEHSEPFCAAVIDLAKNELITRGYEFPG